MVPNVGVLLLGKIYGAFNVASFVVIVWDFIICLPQEKALIWPTRWGAGKVLYIATRYSAFLDSFLLVYLTFPINHSGITCQRVFIASSWLIFTGTIVSEFILIFRTWAVWERNSKLFLTLLIILFFGIILGAVFAHSTISQATFASTKQGYPPGCWILERPSPAIICDYLFVLIFELIILILTLYKRRQAILKGGSQLLITLHRDAIWFCSFIALSSLLNIITHVIPSAVEHGLAAFPEMQRSLHSVLTARILLNLRQAVHANDLNSSSGSMILEPWAVADRGHETAESGIRTGGSSRGRSIQRHSSRVRVVEHSAFGKYFGSIFDLDTRTWTHDEEIARRLENEHGQSVAMGAWPGQGVHSSV